MDLNRATDRTPGGRVLRWQAGAFAALIGFTMLVPRDGSATVLIPLSRDPVTSRIGAEIARGANIAGIGPGGSVVLVNAAEGVTLRALQGGMLALNFPKEICGGKSITNG